MKKSLKISIILFSVIAVLASAASIYYFGAGYAYFSKVSAKECEIPGLSQGFTPQGLAYDAESENMFVCGYMNKKDMASRVYVLGGEDYQDVKYVTLTVDGDEFLGHTGGIAVYQTAVFLVSEGNLYRLNLADLLAAENEGQVDVVDHFETGNGADFVTTKGAELWVGEFYRKGNYETAENHHLTTIDGDENMALSFCYNIDLTHEFGVESTIPVKALSTMGLVQGMAFTDDGKIILSTSYGLSDSNMYIYEDVLSEPTDVLVEVGGVGVPVYMLRSGKLIKKITLPCMSEEIFVEDGKIYVIFESACNKYKMFTRTRLNHIYSMVMDFEE